MPTLTAKTGDAATSRHEYSDYSLSGAVRTRTYYPALGRKPSPPAGSDELFLDETVKVHAPLWKVISTTEENMFVILAARPDMGLQSKRATIPGDRPKATPLLQHAGETAPAKPSAPSWEVIRKHLEHLNYLNDVSSGNDPLISQETARKAARAWSLIWEASGGTIPVPAACTAPDGQMLYTWDRGRHHLELEIIPGEPAVFFYKDRDTRELWEEDYSIGAPIPAEAVKRFRYFV